MALGVELDLKWTTSPESPLLYAHHGPTGRERLRAADVPGEPPVLELAHGLRASTYAQQPDFGGHQ